MNRVSCASVWGGAVVVVVDVVLDLVVVDELDVLDGVWVWVSVDVTVVVARGVGELVPKPSVSA
jgi:hypothetical protein